LCLLPSAPLFIHKMHFKLKITPECYRDCIDLSTCKGNNGKQHEEIIGKARVSYHFYANGTVMVFTECSNNPFKLEDEDDCNRLMALFGQVRDRLVMFLADIRERIVPDITEWELAQCDINKDINVAEKVVVALDIAFLRQIKITIVITTAIYFFPCKHDIIYELLYG